MACPDENTTTAYFERRLSAEEAAHVEEHLAGCDVCRRVLVEYAALAGPAGETLPLDRPGATADLAAPPDDREADLGRRVAVAQAKKRVGSLLCGKWRIVRLIGIGGMAQVFAASHRNGRQVAVKVLRPELAVEAVFVKRFLREGYVANTVGHHGAVAVLDDDMTDDGVPFLVMELLEGRSLAERLREGGAIAAGDALRIADDVLDVLASAHARGIVHRDVKPDNLFETRAGAIKVLDFGIARLREELGKGGDTQSGITMGTVGYMSPEQARGKAAEVDARSDVWAMGATLFTLLTGRVLHEAASTNEALLLAMTEHVPPVRARAESLSPPLCALLDGALAFDKRARFADSRAMQQAVRAARREVDRAPLPFAETPATEPLAPRAPAPARSPTRALALGALAVAIGLSLGVAKLAAREAPPSPLPFVASTPARTTPLAPPLPNAASAEPSDDAPASDAGTALTSSVSVPAATRPRTPSLPAAKTASPTPSAYDPLMSRH